MFEELLYNQTLQIEWNKLGENLELGADEFIKQSSLCTDLSYEHNIKELINKDSMEKFKALTHLLQNELIDIGLYEMEVFDNFTEQLGETIKL